MKKPISLRRRLLFIIIMIWGVPISILFAFISSSYRDNIIEKTENLMIEELDNFLSFQTQRLDEAITISKETSYEKVIENAWMDYKNDAITNTVFYKRVINNLKSKYSNNNRFVMALFYLCDHPENVYYTSRKSDDYISTYSEKVHDLALSITNQDTSDTFVQIIDDELYIIRNMYTTRKYTKFGTLVIQLNKSDFLNEFSSQRDYKLGLFVNDVDSVIYIPSEISNEKSSAIVADLKAETDEWTQKRLSKKENKENIGYLYQKRSDDYNLGAILIADKNKIYSQLDDLRRLIVIIIAVAIPVVIYMIYFFSKHITRPIRNMIDASKEIGKGNMGITITNSMPNEEFTVLADSFNHMSGEVKYLFDYAYNEELARKEAKIIALQSQINPHFLNNTLEMMNWQARLAGDIEVSKMIESLSILLDYTMDRSNRKLISLADELRCADAYFYIISMRFGQRLRVEKQVDQQLLQTQVPQLILQPIMENAVMHGIEIVKSGVIKLEVFLEDENVILQITNTGKGMTQEEVEYVDNILNGTNKIEMGKGKHTSLGIRNVNERIKLIYGEQYGLTIRPVEGTGEVVSRICIPYDNKKNLQEGLMES